MQVPDPEPGDSCDNPKWFVTTRWSVVLAAGQTNAAGSVEALEFLCGRYWPPIYAFIRRRGFAPTDAQDLTQEFFARLLEKNSIEAADASKGKFRTLLLTVERQADGSLLLNGTGPANGGYRLWASVDLLLPFASWTLLKSDAFDCNGNFSYADAGADTNSSRFYQLSIPWTRVHLLC